MTYFSSKGEMDVKKMSYPHLKNARNLLARKLDAGEETGKNNAETLVELDAEITLRDAEFEKNRPTQDEGFA